MDFSLSKEQKGLKDSARRFLRTECPSEFVRDMEEDETGYTHEFWQKVVKLDWMSMMLPEEYDGLDASLLDFILMMEEIGRACMPGPFLSTTLGALTILEGGNENQKSTILPRIANGQLNLSLAYCEPENTRYEPINIGTKAVKEGNMFVIQGTKLFVSDAHVSDYLICTARTKGDRSSPQGISIFLIPKQTDGLKLAPLKTIAGDKQFEVVLDRVKVPEENLIGTQGQGWLIFEKVLQIAALAKCAEMVGGADKVLEMTVDYAKNRTQFGKPIGVFQAIQHHCANMLLDVEGSRYITYKTACLADEGSHSKFWAATAKGWVSEAYKRVIRLGHQIGGGIAVMTEHDLTLYSRRAKAAELAYGDAPYHRKTVASEMGLR